MAGDSRRARAICAPTPAPRSAAGIPAAACSRRWSRSKATASRAWRAASGGLQVFQLPDLVDQAAALSGAGRDGRDPGRLDGQRQAPPIGARPRSGTRAAVSRRNHVGPLIAVHESSVPATYDKTATRPDRGKALGRVSGRRFDGGIADTHPGLRGLGKEDRELPVLSVPAMRCCTPWGCHWKHRPAPGAARGAGFDATTGSGARPRRWLEKADDSNVGGLSPDRRLRSRVSPFAGNDRLLACPGRTSFCPVLRYWCSCKWLLRPLKRKRDALDAEQRAFRMCAARAGISAQGQMGPGLCESRTWQGFSFRQGQG